MRKYLTAVAAGLVLAAPFALAQTLAPPAEAPSAAPGAPEAGPSVLPSPSQPPAAETHAAATQSDSPKLSDDEAKAWIDKSVFSSDQKNVGEVAEVSRDNTGAVTELQADIGGFLGIGETRVRVAPSDFKLMNDRVVLNITAEQANKLPKVESN